MLNFNFSAKNIMAKNEAEWNFQPIFYLQPTLAGP